MRTTKFSSQSIAVKANRLSCVGISQNGRLSINEVVQSDSLAAIVLGEYNVWTNIVLSYEIWKKTFDESPCNSIWSLVEGVPTLEVRETNNSARMGMLALSYPFSDDDVVSGTHRETAGHQPCAIKVDALDMKTVEVLEADETSEAFASLGDSAVGVEGVE